MAESRAVGWLRELGATVVSFDRNAPEAGYALRCTIGVALPLIGGILMKQPGLGGAMAIGAFITGFTSRQGVYRTRLATMLAAAAGMAIASFAGALAAPSLPALVVVTATIGYAYGVVAQLGPAASTGGLNSIVAFVLFSNLPLGPAADLRQSLFVFSGGILQAVLLILSWPTVRLGVERAALAEVYRRLGTYAAALATGEAAIPPIAPLATARQILADPQPLARIADVARFARALEDAEAIRIRLGAVAATIAQFPEDRALRDVVEAVATQLETIGAIFDGSNRRDLDGVRAASRSALDRFETSAAAQRPEAAGVRELATQLVDATNAASMLSAGRIPRFQLSSIARPGPYVDTHVTWFNRDSIRYAAVLAVAMGLARHFSADRGYWIPMTAALVLKPDLRTTLVRGAARIGGTLAGAVLAAVLTLLGRGSAAFETAVVTVAAGASYLTFDANYALFTVAITSFVVMILALRGLPATTTIDQRVLDTLAGGALAMLAYLALPTWERKRTRALLADTIEAQNRLAAAILQGYIARSPETAGAIARERTAVWKLRTAAEASIARTRLEPSRPHTIGAGRALRILGAMQRFALASLALDSALDTFGAATNLPEIAPFAHTLSERMMELAGALRESRRAAPESQLATELAALESQVGSGRPEFRYVVENLRGYADAATRLERLVGTAKEIQP